MAKVRPPRTFGIWLPSEGLTVGDIAISNLSDNHRQLVELGETWVPRSFTARFDRNGLPPLELHVALVDGRFRCVRLDIQRRGDHGFVETTGLRAIKIVQLVREAVELVTYLRWELADQEDVDFARQETERVDPTVDLDDLRVGDIFRFPALSVWIATGERGLYDDYFRPWTGELLDAGERRQTVSDEQVAQVYRAAYGTKEVIQAVADRFGWSRQHAKNRISRARKAGLLPATTPGVPRA